VEVSYPEGVYIRGVLVGKMFICFGMVFTMIDEDRAALHALVDSRSRFGWLCLTDG
jgi:hypothetical protein